MPVDVERQEHWQHEAVALDGLILEIDLPGGRDAVPFAKQIREDWPGALQVMLGEGQMGSIVEHHRDARTGRISRKAVTDYFRRLFGEISDSLPALLGALEFEGPLRAALRAEYGVNLRDPGLSLLDLADLVASLPPGCALWRATGGDMAWSAEMHMLAALEWRLQILAWQKTEDGSKGRNQPKPLEPPKSVHEQQAEERRLSARAEAYLRRTGQH